METIINWIVKKKPPKKERILIKTLNGRIEFARYDKGDIKDDEELVLFIESGGFYYIDEIECWAKDPST